MDEMKDYELDLMVENIHYPHKTEWEIMRYLLWGELAPYQKGHKTPEQMFPLPTDRENSDNHKETEISNEDVIRLKEKSKRIEKLLQHSK